MSDTIGSLIDKLATINQKMFLNQEIIYRIRKMSFEDYKKEFFESEEGALKLWDQLKKSTDLNVQRQQIIQEVDERLIQIIQEAIKGKDLDDGRNIQRLFKTY